ncbi:MAG TPA: LmbE family protein, partial [Cytophagaceae bacterium]
MGLYIENLADQETTTAGEKIKINIEVINRSPIKASLKSISSKQLKDTSLVFDLKENVPFGNTSSITVQDQPFSEPYWLRLPWSTGMYEVNDQELIGLKENPPMVVFDYVINVNGKDLAFSAPLTYKQTDPVEGEIYKPFRILPPVMINLSEKIFLFSESTSKPIEVKLKAGKDNVSGKLYPEVPSGWKIEPSEIEFSLGTRGSTKNYSFKLFPPNNASEGEVKFKAKVGNKEYNEGIIEINYSHIPSQVLLPSAVAKAVRLNIKKKGNVLGYIMGAGDEVPAALSQIGYKVEIIKPADFSLVTFKKYDAIILGIRSYNTVDALKFANTALMTYVKEGGNVIVQYNTIGGFTADNRLSLDSIGPYPFKVANERITDETAVPKFLNSSHPIFNSPNKITPTDFDNWVQERGLYFPKEWSKEYQPLLSFSDPGEQPKEGALLITSFGKGNYIYTGLSFFRQLPAGVAGAYKLFANMVSLGKK